MGIKDLLLKRAITLQEDPAIHRRTLRNGFLAAFIYSFAYGIYEYFIVYNYPTLHNYLGSEINWLIMYTGLMITVFLASRMSIEQTVMGLFFMTMFEDFIFWMSQWIDTGLYPYPAPNWWDSTLASFEALGGLGWAIPFWPYVPFYYLPGFALVSVFYIASYKGASTSRIAAWGIGPFFLAIIAGALGTVSMARVILIALPLVSYAYIITLYSFRDRILD